MIIVVDTSVFISAILRGGGGDSRRVLRLCLEGRCEPVMGEKLFAEYESVMGRQELFKGCPISETDRRELLEGFLSVCRWVTVHYLWRPNLRDEGDNHVLELAVAGGAEVVVTQNVRDFARAELRFPELSVLTPTQFLRKVRL
mgnify:CR=1 FL=1